MYSTTKGDDMISEDEAMRRTAALGMEVGVVITRMMAEGWEPSSDAEGAQQTPYPRQEFTRAVWRRVPEEAKDGFSLVDGTLGASMHTWMELRVEDLARDPLPRRFVIDPCPIETFAPPLMILPGSPFLLLYRRGRSA